MEDTTGSKLRHARKEKELSLEHISKELHIRVHYLKAIEEDALEKIPSKVQANGFLRSYSKYLGLSPKDFPEVNISSIDQIPTIDKIKQLNIERTTKEDPQSASVLFTTIGKKLEARREMLGLSKDDVEAHTHIPSHYVSYIEDGQFYQFPSPAQARGMLTNYVSFLDIPQDEIMLQYAEALQSELSTRQAVQETDQTKPKSSSKKAVFPKLPQWIRSLFSPDLILVSTLGILVIAITIWGIGRVTRAQSELSPPPTAPSLVEALLPSPTTIIPSPTSTQSSGNTSGVIINDTDLQENTPIPTVQVAESFSVQLLLIVRQRAYLKVTVDGTTAFDGRVLPNESLTFSGQDSIELLTGNAAALQVIYNDQDLGILGIFGEVTKMIYTREGVLKPTSVPTPTLSQEEIQTPTPSSTPEEGPILPPSEPTPIP
ncbi:MAG: DUF4115 domain-containing protein [Anaerolineales bacterium]